MSKSHLTAAVVAVVVALIGVILGIKLFGDDQTGSPPEHVLEMFPGISHPGAAPAAADATDAVLLITSPSGTAGDTLTIHRRLLAKGTGEPLDADPSQSGVQDRAEFRSDVVVDAEGETWLTVPARDDAGNTWEYLAESADSDDGEAAWSNAASAGSQWELVIDDGFDGTALDDLWQHRNGPAEAQEDCNTTPSFDHGRNRDYSTDRVTHVADGVLTLGARRTAKCPDGRLVHESGHVGTHEQPAYGGARYLFAARVQFPETSGNHAAFWIRGADSTEPGADQDVNEVDITESFGPFIRGCGAGGKTILDRADGHWTGLQSNVYYAFQVAGGTGPGGYKNCVGVNDAAGAPGLEDGEAPWDAYHVYSAEWEPGEYVKIRYDGELIHTYTGRLASSRPVFVVLSNLINDGARIRGKGDPAMKVDWVRVWKHR